MKKFKDFLYDKNDIIIAFLILVAAALLIIWRMNVIMEYPKQIVGTEDSKTETPVTTPDEGAGTATTDGDNNSDDENTDSDVIWADGILARDMEITVKGDSASAAIQCLIDAGLFEDYAEYQSACSNLGLDHEKVRAGTFTFSKGSSKNDIARAVNWD